MSVEALRQMKSEALQYFVIALRDYPDDYRACAQTYGDTAAAHYAAAECAFIQMHNALPEWGYVVERFELIEGNYLFIHRDLAGTH